MNEENFAAGLHWMHWVIPGEAPIKLYVSWWSPPPVAKVIASVIHVQFDTKPLMSDFAGSIASTMIPRYRFLEEGEVPGETGYVYTFSSLESNPIETVFAEAEKFANIIATSSKFEKDFEEHKHSNHGKAMSVFTDFLANASSWEKGNVTIRQG